MVPEKVAALSSCLVRLAGLTRRAVFSRALRCLCRAIEATTVLAETRKFPPLIGDLLTAVLSRVEVEFCCVLRQLAVIRQSSILVLLASFANCFPQDAMSTCADGADVALTGLRAPALQTDISFKSSALTENNCLLL